MITEADLNALSIFVFDELDCHPDYEADEFAFTFMDYRVYCQRKRNHFMLHIGATRVSLPRC